MNPEIMIANEKIGIGHPSYFIADIAASHNGDLEKAKDLIFAAAEGGANAAKFQNFEAHTIVSDYGFRALGGQKSHQARWQKSVYSVYADASLPLEWTPILRETCDKAGIHYFTSPYSPELIEAVSDYVLAWKMGSGDITWHDQIRAMCQDEKPFMLATGASILSEVEQAVAIAQEYHKNIVLMQCNTDYTATLDDTREERHRRFSCINLNVLKTYKNKFPDCILGLSDHTHGFDTVLASIGLFDVCVIEKHYTLDNHDIGPDHPFSMNPISWASMIQQTRALEKALSAEEDNDRRMQIVMDAVTDPEAIKLSFGDGIKRVEENEQETTLLQRRVLRALRDLGEGSIISDKDFYPLRPAPADGIAPYKYKDLIGKRLKRALVKGEHIKIDDVTS